MMYSGLLPLGARRNLKVAIVLLTLLTAGMLSSCASSPPSGNPPPRSLQAQIDAQERDWGVRLPEQSQTQGSSGKLVLSDAGEYLYTILLNKKRFQSVGLETLPTASDSVKRELFSRMKGKPGKLPSDTSVSEEFEKIHVYTKGVYPDFNPSVPLSGSSVFADNTFEEIVRDNKRIQGKVMYSSGFDKKKFLVTAEVAVQWVEAQTELSVEMDVGEQLDEETPQVVLTVTHPPDVALDNVLFYVNDSAMYADRIGEQTHGRIFTVVTYRLGIPFGKNHLRVQVTSTEGDSANDEMRINNRYRRKPTLHLVAVGINEFPFLPPSSRLLNPENDAHRVRQIFREKGKYLFSDKMDIRPYTLGYAQTTKKNLEMLIDDIRKNIKPNDYFVLFVSSHGILYRNRYYFVPSDFRYALVPDEYGGSEIVNGFGEDQISEYLIRIPTIFRMAILDTCHAGKEVETIKSQIEHLELGRREGISVLAAAKSTQLAMDNYKGNGLFTYVLAEGLEGEADYNRDSVVDSMEIAHYVQVHTSKISRKVFRLAQDAVVIPDPKQTTSRRFELTYLGQGRPPELQPNVFSPGESALYIDGMTNQNSLLMNGIIQNNLRHKWGESQVSLPEQLSIHHVEALLKKHKAIDFSLLFDTDSTTIPRQDKAQLSVIARALNSSALKGKKLLVEGHTDSVGSRAYNIELSQRRADRVVRLLTETFGIERNRLIALGLGEEYPVATNETEAGRARNRRVSVFIYSDED